MKKPPLSGAEQDLLAAINRIAAGKPQNRENRRLSKTGKLELTPTNVAREAGRSRQSIYRSKRIREALQTNSRLHTPEGNALHKIVQEAREDRRTIAEENLLLISNLARARDVALNLLEELEEVKVRLERRGKRLLEAELTVQSLTQENHQLLRQLQALERSHNVN